ncbi:MAG TPA: deoxyribose-phosphate aldolase, partial [Actinomycetota bacterium]|nr:deoxyribose-phosphate aldolase [Actinomycetota bacterium]
MSLDSRSILELAREMDLDDRRVAERARRLMDVPAPPAEDPAPLIEVLRCLDLTTLEPDDTPDRVRALCARARSLDPSPAAVCVLPHLVEVAARELGGSGIRVAGVAGDFPAGEAPLDRKVAEVRRVREAGAGEVDVVIDRRALLERGPSAALDEVRSLVEAAEGALVKVILETGALDARASAEGALAALAAGAAFVKTSTGKRQPGATSERALVLMEAVRAVEAAGGPSGGVKVAGGVRTPEQAL